MIYYNIGYTNSFKHFIDFEIKSETLGKSIMQFQLPAWRPGRYELANFSQNIQKWYAFDEDNNPLAFKKITKDLWEVETNGVKNIRVVYNFYANKLDAGSSYLDEHQLYLNPVNCMFYIVGRMDDTFFLSFDIPNNYDIASSMQRINNTLSVKGYDMLAESPVICSQNLQHEFYNIDDIRFNLWFQGECNPDWKKIIKDFSAFTRIQIDKFGGFPVKEYHYFFQITPYRSYHGVEHTDNPVLLLGPGSEMMN